MQVIGYVRVSTSEQADSGLGLDAQRHTINLACNTRGWHLIDVVEDAGYSAKDLHRPGIEVVRNRLQTGEATALLVSKLDRITRSTLDAANLLADATREGWQLIALDVGADPTTPQGELMLSIIASMAQWERKVIGARTKDAMRAARERGVRLGRPVVISNLISDRIVAERNAGSGWDAIALKLQREQIATAQGGKWHGSTVRSIYLRCNV